MAENKTALQLRDQVDSFYTTMDDALTAAQRDTKFDNHYQWDADDAATLEARGQPPVVINRLKRKINTLVGVQEKFQGSPRALPRNPGDEDKADAVTEALRFVVDNNDFDILTTEVFRRELVWGYGGAIIETEKAGNGDIEVKIREVSPDRYYFDPHSRKRDFSDKTFDGIAIWLHKSQAKNLFPGNDEVIDGAFSSDELNDIDSDKPSWYDTKSERLKICQHYHLQDGKWMLSYLVGNSFLTVNGKAGPVESPLKDEFGNPANPIVMQSAYVDDENQRYGEARGLVWLQKEYNWRRSKFLYNMSTRQVVMEQGAVDNVGEVKQELAKADGVVVKNPGLEFQILENSDMAQGQFLLLQHTQAEIDAVGVSGQLAADLPQDASGRLAQIIQGQDVAEVANLFKGHKAWERRVYRQIWARIKQFWDSEKWIRVTDDEKNLRWVGLNREMTAGQYLQEVAAGDLTDPNIDPQTAANMLQMGTGLNDGSLDAKVKLNGITDLDMDIVMTESPDFLTIRQEQFATLAEVAKAGSGPLFRALLELSDMPRKERVLNMLEPDPQMAQRMEALEQQVQQLNIEGLVLENLKKRAEIEDTAADTDLTRSKKISEDVQTALAAQAGTEQVNVSL